MIKIKSGEMLRSTILFGLTGILFVFANLLPLLGDNLWEAALNILLVGIIFLNISIWCSLIKNVRRDIALLVFVAAFDILLLGRVYVAWIGNYDIYLSVLEAQGYPQLFQALQIVATSLFFVYLSYRLVSPTFIRREMAIEQRGMETIKKDPLIPVLRQLSAIILYISSIPFFYSLVNTILNVRRYGYLNSFTNNADNIPSAIARLSMFFIPSFAVFLATLPNKKQMKAPMIVYGIYMVSSLFTGRRNTIVTEALMLIVYFVLRDSLLPKEKRTLKKKTVIGGGVFGLAAVYFLQMVALIRAGMSSAGHGILDTLVGFVNSQGASFRVIIQTVNNINLFNHTVSYQYLFYPFELFAHNNLIVRTLFGLNPIVEVQNSSFVKTTHNFAHVLTYMVDPSRYLSGGGFGTSYIAEAYVAFGVVGVIMISIMFGIIFRYFASMITRSWPVLACSLIAVKELVYVPRNFAFLWVSDVFNITYLCFFLAIYVAALIIVKVGTHTRVAGEYSRELQVGVGDK